MILEVIGKPGRKHIVDKWNHYLGPSGLILQRKKITGFIFANGQNEKIFRDLFLALISHIHIVIMYYVFMPKQNKLIIIIIIIIIMHWNCFISPAKPKHVSGCHDFNRMFLFALKLCYPQVQLWNLQLHEHFPVLQARQPSSVKRASQLAGL